jgi:hypothetical protein
VPHELTVASAQLARMRGMNAAYHRQFFTDIRFTTLVTLGLFVAAFAVDDRLVLALPVVALVGACQTAFDASYLIFSRHYASSLERFINSHLEREVLVAHRLEDSYLFGLDRTKLVTLSVSPGAFTWFGFMTGLYTAVGVGVYVIGIVLSLDVIGTSVSVRAGAAYLISLAIVTVTAAVVGVWWFVGGEGERRLRHVLDESFPPDREAGARA